MATSLDYLLKNTTGGHDHDGSDSKKVIATNLNVTGLTASQLLQVNSGGTAVESSGKTVPSGTIVGTTDSQTLTNKTLTTPTLTLKQGTAPTPTSEGDIQWDTDDNKIVVGDGASQKVFVPTASVSGDATMDTAGALTIANDAVTAAKIATGAVGTTEISSDAVTPAKLALSQDSATTATEETTTSTSYADLSTVGPSISYSPGATQTVLLLYGCYCSNSSVGNTTFVTPVISGATTLAAADSNAARLRPTGTSGQEVVSISRMMLTTLSSGANTIKLQYRVEGGTGSFGSRFLIMIPLS